MFVRGGHMDGLESTTYVDGVEPDGSWFAASKALVFSGVGPAPSPVIMTRSADVSVRGGLMDGLESPSSVAGAWLAAFSSFPAEPHGSWFAASKIPFFLWVCYRHRRRSVIFSWSTGEPDRQP
ncbi:MAG: hypothetical protein R6V12_05650 [Candidatus Hydrogenedentota bacterium]